MATVINGISYNNGDPFVCAKSAAGNANEAGTSNSAIALTVGKTYYFIQKGSYSAYPYLVSDGSNYIGWYTAEVFPTGTYTITYNANGGSGAPSSQTKSYGVSITLRTTSPTRSGYTFLGWSTTASGTVAYSPGATYIMDASVTLYAVWQQNTSTTTYNAYTAYIYNGSSWEAYTPYIYNGSSWEAYTPYIS